jgi:hypothetical protein
MPKLAQMSDRFSIVRSISGIEAVHERAVYHLLTAHRQNPALAAEIPHLASVVSYKLADQRRPGDSLPTAMLIGPNPAKNGLFPIDHRGLEVTESGRVRNLDHAFDGAQTRFALLDNLLAEMAPTDDARADHLRFREQARTMMLDPDLRNLLSGLTEDPGDDDPAPATTNFRAQCETALRVIAADKGTRVFQLSLGDWDHHDFIYDPELPYGLPALAGAFDEGFSYLIRELADRPGHMDGQRLLDETLLVAVGEFGRTVGLNTAEGRDHWPYAVPAILAGGGVKGGRIIGSTTNDGAYVLDPGWSQHRLMGINDLTATLYSALGIDWTERFEDTPSGRTFEIVDPSLSGTVYDIEPLFV